VLFPKSGTNAPAVQPTAATLQTDQGPLDLTVAGVSSDENNTVWGTVRVDLGLPSLTPGVYRAEFLDLADATGTWRFRIGEFVISVLPAPMPTDLVRDGGDIELGQSEGGSVQAFEIGLLNITHDDIAVTDVSTDIPGLPVEWLLAKKDPVRIVPRVGIPAGMSVTVTVGTRETAQPVAFVLATPEVAYRVGAAREKSAVFDAIEFQSGFGAPSDVPPYVASLPADACAQQS
jgi:hypothetical protein